MLNNILYATSSFGILVYLIKNMDSFIGQQSTTRYVMTGLKKVEFCPICQSQMQYTKSKDYLVCLSCGQTLTAQSKDVNVKIQG